MEEQEISNWYIMYTNHSIKKVIDLLEIAGIESYFPSKTITRRWKNLFKTIDTPIIPHCFFVNAIASDIIVLQMMREISFIVNAQGQKIQFTANEIALIKTQLDKYDTYNGLLKQKIQCL